MGQQQLLLLVLGIVIVGLAVIIGIGMFSINQSKANADSMVTEALRMASDIQAWALKPGMFGGRLETETLAQVTMDDLGLPHSGGVYRAIDGDFMLSTTLGTECDPPHVPSQNTPLIYINASNDDTGNNICVAIAGTSADDIGTSAHYGSGISF